MIFMNREILISHKQKIVSIFFYFPEEAALASTAKQDCVCGVCVCVCVCVCVWTQVLSSLEPVLDPTFGLLVSIHVGLDLAFRWLSNLGKWNWIRDPK
jgi:hypothetical protein